MTAKVIFNPYAARWKALERQPELESALKSAAIDYELVSTDGPNHAVSLTVDAIQGGFSPIIAAGGDGLIGEVVNGMLQSSTDMSVEPLGVLPMGTANDLADNLGIPGNLDQAAQLIAGGETRMIDVCTANERHFVNNAGLGLEPFITLIQQRITRIRGTVRYLLATLSGIRQNPGWNMHLEWDQGDYSGPVTLISIGNCARTGGLFYTVPHADPFDGKLSFVYGSVPSRREILQLLPRTMKPGPGNYVEHPAVHEVHASWLRVHCEPPTPMHADGEIVTKSIQEISFTIQPARIPILLTTTP